LSCDIFLCKNISLKRLNSDIFRNQISVKRKKK
jgi:hypothetical protein